MATYKAEFLYHHYKRRLRPRPAYAMGLLPLTAPWMARLPRLANLLMRAPLVSRVVRAAGGLAPQRELPRFATSTFRQRFRKHRRARARGGRAAGTAKRVLLYPDTFTDFFDPEIGEAAVEVLEAAGFTVEIPRHRLCCGRPLYDYGFVGVAKRLLRRNLDALREPLAAGVPIVGLEPSCVAAFRDELPALFPAEADAMRLKHGFLTLAEFFAEHAPDWQPPQLRRKAVVHGHCHHKAVMRMHADQKLLDRLGLEHELLDSGCCGLAGSFGFEAAHYDVSMACGEDALLPLVREQDARTLVLADGFSCRNQIAHGTERRGLHLAQVLQMALREGSAGPPGAPPERGYVTAAPAAGAAGQSAHSHSP
jgi:Fe-S oxidoreductase